MTLSGLDPYEKQSSSNGALIKAYEKSISRGEIKADPEQQNIINELQLVYSNIVNQSSDIDTKSSFFSFFRKPKTQLENIPIQGLYLYGGVGRGKTHLVDFFFEHLPIKRKMRLHFHRFMQIVHEELAKLESVSDPLKQVANGFTAKARVLCFDEFHVIDITDAMLLGRLFEHLFDDGLVLVTTSNFHPDDLYKNGLQRERFVPAINLLKQHTKLVKMGGDYDYRSHAFKELGIYYFVHGENNSKSSEEHLNKHFKQLSGIDLYHGRKAVIINKRKIPVKKFNAGVVWFEFEELCNTPRSTEDFIQIAAFFKTVLISNIPVMDSSSDDAARRFINMIDTFYDMHVSIVVSAAEQAEKLYSGQKLNFEFDRAISRINEMQTTKYIETTHLVRESSDNA